VYSSLVENSATAASATVEARQVQTLAPQTQNLEQSSALEGDATCLAEGNPLRMLRFGPMVRKGNKHGASASNQVGLTNKVFIIAVFLSFFVFVGGACQ